MSKASKRTMVALLILARGVSACGASSGGTANEHTGGAGSGGSSGDAGASPLGGGAGSSGSGGNAGSSLGGGAGSSGSGGDAGARVLGGAGGMGARAGAGGASDCGPGCVRLCEGGMCDCSCLSMGGSGGAPQRRCGPLTCRPDDYCHVAAPGVGATTSYACTPLDGCTNCPCLDPDIGCNCSQASDGYITVMCAGA